MAEKMGILGRKLGMTRIFAGDGSAVAVTVIQAGPCPVTQVKTVKTDGYEAVQVGVGELAEKRAQKLKNKPELGHFAKAGVPATRYLRELRLDDITPYKVGDQIRADVFAEGDKVDVSGTSKGHGYTGAIQRWNQHTGPMAHGSKYPRQAHGRTVRLRKGHRPESGSDPRGRRAQPAPHQGRTARSERLPARHP